MIPIIQKNIHNPEKGVFGDCYRACICSLLEISDEGVENFVENKEYPMNIVRFLKNKGFRLRYGKTVPRGIDFYMACGISPRGVRHAVIYNNGKLVHDPHPIGGGVIVDEYQWLEPRSDRNCACVNATSECACTQHLNTTCANK